MTRYTRHPTIYSVEQHSLCLFITDNKKNYICSKGLKMQNTILHDIENKKETFLFISI